MSRVNLHYIRAAILENTGQHLSLEATRELMVDEGIISAIQAEKDAQIFYGYGDYYASDSVPCNPKEDKGPRELRFAS